MWTLSPSASLSLSCTRQRLATQNHRIRASPSRNVPKLRSPRWSNRRIPPGISLQADIRSHQVRWKVVAGDFSGLGREWFCRPHFFPIRLVRGPSFTFCPSLPFYHLPNSILCTLIHCFVYVHRCFWDRHHEHHPSWCSSCSILLRPHHEISHGHLCSLRRHLRRSTLRWLVFPVPNSLWTDPLANHLFGDRRHPSHSCTNRLPLGHSHPHPWHRFLWKVGTKALLTLDLILTILLFIYVPARLTLIAQAFALLQNQPFVGSGLDKISSSSLFAVMPAQMILPSLVY